MKQEEKLRKDKVRVKKMIKFFKEPKHSAYEMLTSNLMWVIVILMKFNIFLKMGVLVALTFFMFKYKKFMINQLERML